MLLTEKAAVRALNKDKHELMDVSKINHNNCCSSDPPGSDVVEGAFVVAYPVPDVEQKFDGTGSKHQVIFKFKMAL